MRFVKDGEEVEVRGRLQLNFKGEADSINVLTGEGTIAISAAKIIHINPRQICL
ncbi:MAG: hypothetical protein Q7J85_09405 [Bacillota bacterium]|nr:hypothetical protein [Bacillota bacterium]